MRDITNNEMGFLLCLFKNQETEYNANSISKLLGISAMGALKIAGRLLKERIVVSKELGKARFYKLNWDNDYVMGYIAFLLRREAEHSHPYIKMWIDELKKLKSADAAILFGSVLKKHGEAGDIDSVLVTDEKRFATLKAEVYELDQLNAKKLHPVYQTKEDFIKNIKKGDKVLLDAVKRVTAFGEEVIVDLVRT